MAHLNTPVSFRPIGQLETECHQFKVLILVLILMCEDLMWSSKTRNYGIWLIILNLKDMNKNT